jgi:hypothetical protein
LPVIVDARNAAPRDHGTYARPQHHQVRSTVPPARHRDQFHDAEWALGIPAALGWHGRLRVVAVSRSRAAAPGVTPAGGVDVVREQIVKLGATAKVKQRAFTTRDGWSITDNLSLHGGRWDS